MGLPVSWSWFIHPMYLMHSTYFLPVFGLKHSMFIIMQVDVIQAIVTILNRFFFQSMSFLESNILLNNEQKSSHYNPIRDPMDGRHLEILSRKIVDIAQKVRHSQQPFNRFLILISQFLPTFHWGVICETARQFNKKLSSTESLK